MAQGNKSIRTSELAMRLLVLVPLFGLTLSAVTKTVADSFLAQQTCLVGIGISLLAMVKSIEPESTMPWLLARILYLALVSTLTVPATGNQWLDLAIMVIILSVGIQSAWLPMTYAASKRQRGERFAHRRWIEETLKFGATVLAIDFVLLPGTLMILKADIAGWWLIAGVLASLGDIVLGWAQKHLVTQTDPSLGRIPVTELAPELAALIKKSAQHPRIFLQSEDERHGGGQYFSAADFITVDESILKGPLEKAKYVLAHEMGHAFNRRRCAQESFILSALRPVVVFALTALICRQYFGAGAHEFLSDIAHLPMLLLTYCTINMLFWWVPLAHSRFEEGRTDRYALRLIGNAHGLRSFFSTSVYQIGWIEAFIWRILNCFCGTHPTALQTVAMADRWEQKELRKSLNPCTALK